MKNLFESQRFKIILKVCIVIFAAFVFFNNLLMPFYVHSAEVRIPKVVGMNQNSAIEALEQAGLEPIVGATSFNESVPQGNVILQKPSCYEIVKKGRRVYLYVSGGDPTVQIPSLTGKSVRDAKFLLDQIGLKLGKVTEIASSSPKGLIVSQEFPVGVSIKRGATISLSVSGGAVSEGNIVVPDLTGKSLAEAEKILADSSLKVGKINYQPSFSLLPNTIIDQYPGKGTKLNAGGAVDLFVTKSVDEDKKAEEKEE
jgi:eukaryotic-like serine/threonine-protein kinase